MLTPKGTLYIISAPSGCGKTSLVNALVATTDDILVSISHTTRPMRPGEKDGVNYFFINEAEFKTRIADNQFLEYAQVLGMQNWYGTSKTWVEEQLALDKDVILEIDWQGARQVKWMIPDSVGIFILPPSLEALKHRLRNRAQDSDDIIEHRMKQAETEMSHFQEYEYLIINDNFNHALQQLKAIIITERLKIDQQSLRQGHLLSQIVTSR